MINIFNYNNNEIYYLPTSLEAKSLALGAYLSINLSPRPFFKKPPSPLQPSVIKHPDPFN